MKLTIDVDPYHARCFMAWMRKHKFKPAEAFGRMLPKEARYCLEEEIGEAEADEIMRDLFARIKAKLARKKNPASHEI